ncbi:ABC transporter ATP-binding protein [Polycladidibacter stylochi]|uniref:ABC transporter ATP-binding protein n=1 Tax=Polycladidibacter stylochi TaxID=1807766 RepID=UPI000829D991|nr:ABC transporter ATP-binding protein [Pseudovibrio stylochi]
MAFFKISNLNVHIGKQPIISGLDLSIARGETLGLVGESGSGKSMCALAAMQLLPEGSRTTGSISYQNQELLEGDEELLNRIRGRHISMVFQEPMTALNPVMNIGQQIAESLICHGKRDKEEITAKTHKLLERVGLLPAQDFSKRYPHQLSGGQRQRVVIAIAIACKPRLLIADEPTTALDVTIQAQILALLKDIVRKEKMGLLLISHDLAVVADMADKVAIMKNGRILEHGPTAQLFANLQHPYSRDLLTASQAIAPLRKKAVPTNVPPLLYAKDIEKNYRHDKAAFWRPMRSTRAVDDVTLAIAPHQSVGLVGESGCGKSTLARSLLGLDHPDEGIITFMGRNPYGVKKAERRLLQRNMQAVFQDPYSSFNPRHRVARIVGEPLYLQGKELTSFDKVKRVVEAIKAVGLSETDLDKFPHEFSGGQRQRIAIARALVTEPKLIIADEPVSALDVSIRAQILNLFADLRDRLGIAYLFISHDLSVVRAITDYVYVMNAGQIVEHGPTRRVFEQPKHPYTRLLLAAAPSLTAALQRRAKIEQKQTNRL